jgi:hypothetical protein
MVKSNSNFKLQQQRQLLIANEQGNPELLLPATTRTCIVEPACTGFIRNMSLRGALTCGSGSTAPTTRDNSRCMHCRLLLLQRLQPRMHCMNCNDLTAIAAIQHTVQEESNTHPVPYVQTEY